MIIALAGRRVDAPDAAVVRFPPANVSLVRENLRALFEQKRPRALVSSAACGSDLLAQDVAQALGIERWIVLPYPREEFLKRSVTDRPGDWDELFDDVLSERAGSGVTVVQLGEPLDADHSQEAYRHANEAIIDCAQSIADGTESVLAVVVWDGESRGTDDLTADFQTAAMRRQLQTASVSTLG